MLNGLGAEGVAQLKRAGRALQDVAGSMGPVYGRSAEGVAQLKRAGRALQDVAGSMGPVYGRTWLLRDTERYQPNDDFGIRAPVSKST